MCGKAQKGQLQLNADALLEDYNHSKGIHAVPDVVPLSSWSEQVKNRLSITT